MANIYVYSKMSTSVEYVDWLTSPDMPIKGPSVVIHGGAGVANKNLITPLGVMTEITEEEAAILHRNPVFQQHQKGGFVTIESVKEDVEKVISNLTAESDPSAPLTPGDFDSAEDVIAKPMKTGKK